VYEAYGYEDVERPSWLDWTRLGIGLAARGIFWLCFVLIVGNAVVQAIADDEWVLAVFEVAFFPLTFLIYPFAADPLAQAWPLADGTNLIPFLVAAVVAYPISTFVGGLPPVE